MLNRLSDLVRLRTFANGQVQAVSRANPDTLNGLMPGDHVHARVEAVMPDGTFRVLVGNRQLLLRLPVQPHAGDTLQLNVVAGGPHFKFALVAADDPGALSTTLSETARFITALLDESDRLPLTAAVRPGAALLESLSGGGARTAAALRDALVQSGIFYEAHQAQWAAGERAITQLMREPQARFEPLRRQGAAEAGNGGDPESPLIVADRAPGMPELPVHRDALALIRQQLDTLESRQVGWHGMIWHGQPLDWEIVEEDRPTPAPTDETQWRTRLRLTLPRLGRIDATLRVAERGVSIILHAADTDALAGLTAHRAQLQKSLGDAGVNSLGIAVRRNESA
ncbi:MAG: flagellar hook-length control protein FliK [Betaproteobacteria bacterium]|nr:flagellar hook-length control protein FliK [Betaproteobacteria bacterium]